MGFETFISIFNCGFLDLKEKRLDIYGWQHYFWDIVETRLKIPRKNRAMLSKSIELAYFDRCESITERDKFEAIMLCILDIAQNAELPDWDKSSIDRFMLKMEMSHFDAYLLYLEIRRNQSKA